MEEFITRIPTEAVAILTGAGWLLKLYDVVRKWRQRTEPGVGVLRAVIEVTIAALASTATAVTVMVAFTITTNFITTNNTLANVNTELDGVNVNMIALDNRLTTAATRIDAIPSEIVATLPGDGLGDTLAGLGTDVDRIQRQLSQLEIAVSELEPQPIRFAGALRAAIEDAEGAGRTFTTADFQRFVNTQFGETEFWDDGSQLLFRLDGYGFTIDMTRDGAIGNVDP